MAGAAIPFAIQAGTSLLGGLFGSSAAKKAAAAEAAAGRTAMGLYQNTPADVNPMIQSNAEQAANWAITNAQNVGADTRAAATQANNLLNPYYQAGQGSVNLLAQGLQPGGDLSQKFNADTFQSLDPGFNFRMQQGQQALERSAAARTGNLGGAAAKAMARYSQDYASNEFQNAFNRFTTQQQQRYNMLAGVAGMGQSAANVMGANTIGANEWAGNQTVQAGQYGGNMLYNAGLQQANNTIQGADLAAQAAMGIGNAQAAGYMGNANAWSNAFSGIGNAAGGYFAGRAGPNPYQNNFNSSVPYLPTTPGVGDTAGMNVYAGYQPTYP